MFHNVFPYILAIYLIFPYPQNVSAFMQLFANLQFLLAGSKNNQKSIRNQKNKNA